MAVAVMAFDGRFLDRPVHPLRLTVCPGMIGLGQTVLDAVFSTGAIKGVPTNAGCGTVAVLRQTGKPNANFSQHGVDRIRDRCNQFVEKS